MALPVGRQTVRKLRKTLSAPDFLKKKAIQRDEKSAVLGTVDSEISKSNKTTTKKKERARPDSRFEIGGFGTRRRRSIAPSTASVGRRGIFFLFDRRFPAIFRRPVLMTSRRRGAFIFGRSIGRHQIKRRNRDAGTIGFFLLFAPYLMMMMMMMMLMMAAVVMAASLFVKSLSFLFLAFRRPISSRNSPKRRRFLRV